MSNGAVTRFLSFPGCRVSLSGSREAVDRGELLINHLGLCGDEETDRSKIDRLVASYKKTAVSFPEITYEKK